MTTSMLQTSVSDVHLNSLSICMFLCSVDRLVALITYIYMIDFQRFLLLYFSLRMVRPYVLCVAFYYHSITYAIALYIALTCHRLCSSIRRERRVIYPLWVRVAA